MKITKEETVTLLKQNDKFAIICHSEPDGDTLGSGYALCRALQKLGKRAKVICEDKIPSNYGFFKSIIVDDDFNPEYVVSADLADESLLGEFEETYGGKIDLSIDHHISNTDYAKNTLFEAAAATAEIIYELIKLLKVEIDCEIAKSLYAGIATDTGCFRFSNTTKQSHLIAAELMNFDFNLGELNFSLFEFKSKRRIMIETAMIKRLEYYFNGKVVVTSLSKTILDMAKGEDISGISSIPRRIEGVELSITFKEQEPNIWKVSMRSNTYVNVQNICAAFDGGGHAKAAGCRIKGIFEECRDNILSEVEKHL
ncbi:MAG: bifunctional oligoribonuclease/PAP phosphatase NrnA [Eubacterium sp.]|jgi:phosphoesterase RecJ-like protein|nr:bifunctional oligoribonuclease/PAP phosphatase NrnA [Eubacterium sp.]